VTRVIIVTGSIHARPETVAEIEALSLAHVRRSREEPGCLAHSAHRDVEDGLHLVFFEQWADAAALRTHFEVPASQEFVRSVGPLAERRPEMAVFTAETASL
jgi:quinol monooxygenase YgiN